MRKADALTAVFVVVSILYPLGAAFAVRAFGPLWVVAALCVLLLARGALGLKRQIPLALTYGLIAVAAGIALVAIFDRALSVRLYPALMNAAMLAAFAQTLWRGPSMIERFARLMEPNLPESGVRYTRIVTWIWVAFFAINGAIAIWTAIYADWSTWTLYNGLIAYIAMGVLFAGEWVVRPFARRAAKNA
ncbi:MAG TPA: hypothetical protein VG841_06140 [Caulobacterales bacterium]|nr:hypothetical protein [Caulobacterales bacterium]